MGVLVGPHLWEVQVAARFSQPRTIEAAAVQPLTAQPALPNSETILDSGAENGQGAEKKT
jgi:hypothetical protein